jgi:tetratricopeptide (TPR) repeat protein
MINSTENELILRITKMSARSPSATKAQENALKLLQKGEKALDELKFDRARESFAEAIPLFEAAENPLGAAQCYHFIGIAWEQANDYKQALEFYYRALKIRESSGDVLEISDTQKKIARMLIEVGDLDGARDACQHAIDLLETIENPISLADALYLQGTIYMKEEDYKTAVFYLNMAVERMGTINSPYLLRLILEAQGKSLTKLAKYPESNAALMRSMTLYGNQSNSLKIAELSSCVSKNWQELDDQEKAIRFIEDAIKIVAKDSIAPLHFRLALLTQYGETLLYFGNIIKAEQIIEETIILAEENNLLDTLIQNLLLMAQVVMLLPFSKEHPKEQATQYAQEALDHAIAINNTTYKCKSYITMARASLRLNERDQYVQHLNVAMDIAKNEENHLMMGKILLEQGVTAHKEMNYQKAWQFFKEALDHFDKIPSIEDQGQAHYNLACTASQLHLGEEIIQHLKMAIEINRRYKYWARDDEDFRGISEEPLFRNLIE